MLIIITAGLAVLRGTMHGGDAYGAFLRGAERGMRAAARLLPSLCAMLAMVAVAEASGLADRLAALASPFTDLLHLPRETAPLMLLRPLTGSGSLSILADMLAKYGPDSRTGRVASVLVGSSETIFYTLTVYLAGARVKRLPWVVPVSMVSYLVGALAAGLVIR